MTAESPEKLKKIVNSFEKTGIMFDPEKMAKQDVRLIFTADKRYIASNDNNRILQNWAKFIYIDPQDRKAREPILKSDYSLRRILSLVWVSLRDPNVVQKSQKYAKVKFDEIVSKIKIKNKTD